jgi:hypothetical protein
MTRQPTFALLAALASLTACSGADSPERQVRAVIEQIELAAENRNVSGLTGHLSEDFRDSRGMGPEEVARYLRGYFIANQSIHLLTRIEHLEFPTENEARAEVLVGMLGREAAAAARETDEPGALTADLHTFKVALRREDGEWKVTFASLAR